MSVSTPEKSVNFGARFKTIRISFGMTQQQLADFLAISLQSVSRYERGIVAPQITELFPLVERGIDLNWLVTGDGEMLRNDNNSPLTPSLTMPSIDRARMRSIISALFDMIKSGSEILEYPPEALADWLVQGYEWLGTMSPDEKHRRALKIISAPDDPH